MCALPHLASHILGAILRRLRSDWQDKYDIAPCLAETVRVPRLTDTDSSGDALQPPREWLTRQRTGSERHGSETSSRCSPGAAIGNGNQVVGHKLIADKSASMRSHPDSIA